MRESRDEGFTQVQGLDYNKTFSPTSRYDSIRLLLSIAARDDLQIKQFDVMTAFLYGELSEEIHMDVPEGLETQPSKLCSSGSKLRSPVPRVCFCSSRLQAASEFLGLKLPLSSKYFGCCSCKQSTRRVLVHPPGRRK